MKWIVSVAVLLFQVGSFASSSILSIDNDLFSTNIYCEVLSDLGFPTGAKIDVSLYGDKAVAYWMRNHQVFEQYNGTMIDSKTDPVVQKFIEVTGKPSFGFKFHSPNENDPSILRLIILNDTNDWMPSYLILTTPTKTNESSNSKINETVLLSDHVRCTYYETTPL